MTASRRYGPARRPSNAAAFVVPPRAPTATDPRPSYGRAPREANEERYTIAKVTKVRDDEGGKLVWEASTRGSR